MKLVFMERHSDFIVKPTYVSPFTPQCSYATAMFKLNPCCLIAKNEFEMFDHRLRHQLLEKVLEEVNPIFLERCHYIAALRPPMLFASPILMQIVCNN